MSRNIVMKEMELSFCLAHKAITKISFYRKLSELSNEKLPSIPYSKVFAIIDNKVNKVYGDRIRKALQKSATKTFLLEVPESEAAKTFHTYQKLCNDILRLEIDHNSLILNIGGGTICNIGGFVASTMFRGIDFIHMPTTLLAQNDAAIGNKQAINTEHGKNMIGTYQSPKEVWIVLEFLDTLPPREISSGIAESIKHALAQNKELFDILNEENLLENRAERFDNIVEVIRMTIESKINLMEIDYKEENLASALQYGHTIGHAIEFLSNYMLRHGEAISIGMFCAATFARQLHISSRDTLQQHVEVLSKYNLPLRIPKKIASQDIVDNLTYNKKRCSENSISLVLLRSIGEIYHVDTKYGFDMDTRHMLAFLKQCY